MHGATGELSASVKKYCLFKWAHSGPLTARTKPRWVNDNRHEQSTKETPLLVRTSAPIESTIYTKCASASAAESGKLSNWISYTHSVECRVLCLRFCQNGLSVYRRQTTCSKNMSEWLYFLLPGCVFLSPIFGWSFREDSALPHVAIIATC